MNQDQPPEREEPPETSPFKSRPGLERLLNATRYSMAGLAAAWRDESAFRQELALCAVLLPLGLWLGDTGVERALLVAPLVLVLVVELLNSAIEAVVDLASPQHHALAARAKDLGSAAVFASLVLVAVAWGLVLL